MGYRSRGLLADAGSVCKLACHSRNQAYHQGERDHEVGVALAQLSLDTNVQREDDSKWPEKNRDGRQELEIRLGNEHISFEAGHHSCLRRVRMANDRATDSKDRIIGGRHGVCRPRRHACVLLLGARFEGLGFLSDIAPLQGRSSC